MRIIDRLRHQALIKNIPWGTSTPKNNPLLKKQLEQTQKDLNSILKNWKFGDVPIKNSKEFLDKFGNWINTQLDQQKELSEFLKDKGVNNLSELPEVPTNKKLEEFLNFHKVKSLTELEQTWNNTEQDYLEQIKELQKKKPEGEWEKENAKLIKDLEKEVKDLEIERDEAIRNKKTAEQENLSLSNKLKLKSQEAENKVKEIERLKKEKSASEIALNKTIKELREREAPKTREIIRRGANRK